MEDLTGEGVGLMVVVPAPMFLTRSDIRNILNRSHRRARGRNIYVVILCLDYDENILDLFDAFDGNVAITATTLSVLSDQERRNQLVDRILASTRNQSGVRLQNLDLGQDSQFGSA